MQSSANGSENQRAQPQAQQLTAPAPSPPQWTAAMPYPGATMIMPNQMMAAAGLPPPPPPPYAPHYIPFHQVPPLLPQYQLHQQQQPGSADENRTIWVGDLQYWMDENYLQHCFGHTGEVRNLVVFSLHFLSSTFVQIFFFVASLSFCHRRPIDRRVPRSKIYLQHPLPLDIITWVKYVRGDFVFWACLRYSDV